MQFKLDPKIIAITIAIIGLLWLLTNPAFGAAAAPTNFVFKRIPGTLYRTTFNWTQHSDADLVLININMPGKFFAVGEACSPCKAGKHTVTFSREFVRSVDVFYLVEYRSTADAWIKYGEYTIGTMPPERVFMPVFRR